MVDPAKLYGELVAAGLPVVGCSGANPTQGASTSVRTWHQRAEGWLYVDWSAPPTAAQQTAAANVVAAHDGTPRKARTLYAIYTDLVALTATQKGNVWTDLTSGSPHKYLLDAGPNAAAIAALEWAALQSGASAAAILDAKLRLTAIYVQDNAKYLVAPSFDPTINVAGDMPA